ncbi:VIT1/CCC1 transporter family protein [Ethanoligenens harbinense]|uniref:Rubrerythrin family protein n=1 Tax=Ethanoligenens harbinense (strain DSM 18485 / JCM 12961 / CGMCC 1.5033 / YUAN-3) TaxID=663278 RepID=E6U7U1_ETHHY|nr:VIT1/CCC1 family protein [Ethanoligenens harbinense]ADU28214.1 protein of unknown function DUF125 transmembrane [Ethanoligenens harbinense YUAN-3]AVQ97210.1 rubrerythrin family protein [Ethanoligenens harbinense YUAN-3]AYF39874.1 rubrerythrin family protein [Ethanoligenens harbinense]AYF42706.1 rubrerythrin family protein [Ethanoligenens harbinense]QCN93456.1 rubrerythrin family protein [Ethanoligenens harbinense]
MSTHAEKSFLRHTQQQECNSSVLYAKLARLVREPSEQKKLLAISRDESTHADTFARYSGKKLRPNRLLILFQLVLARLFGYTFLIKLMEKGEDKAQELYRQHQGLLPELDAILRDEARHENELIAMLDEERLNYVGDMVLGMNDALVELTGSLAGYTLALPDTRAIAMAGLITGIAATLSMMSSSYLSSRASGASNALKSGMYTGVAYIITVALLILPYLLLPVHAYLLALLITLIITVAIIALFNYYISVAQGQPFRRNFATMAVISLGVAGVSFLVGLLVKQLLGVNL